jgi:anti-sigma regulatory factor (Ser/Thr protein kinase)
MRSRPPDPWAGQPLSMPPEGSAVHRYRANLSGVREFTAAWAHRAALSPLQASNLVMAVAELAANTLRHTTGPGTLTLWTTDNEVICQVQDEGQITDPQAGSVLPAPQSADGGRGLWLVRQVGDGVEIRTGPGGTTVRVHMRLGSGWA